MPVSWTILIVLALSGLGYLATRSRAVRLAGGDIRKLHSRPSYYGWNAALLIGVPALFVTAIWRFLWPATSPVLISAVALILAAAGLAFALTRTAPRPAVSVSAR